MKEKFYHTEVMDRLKTVQARAVSATLVELFSPRTVVDVGCGTAALLKAFKSRGVKVTGIDGRWVNKKILLENIAVEEFVERDLEKRIALDRRFDLVVCLEVAEHLSEGRAETLVQDMTELGDTVVFSAAIPGQGGQNHINEQWLPYWIEKFQTRGYSLVNILREKFWENEDILWWYRQNAVVFTADEAIIEKYGATGTHCVARVVHPELFAAFADYRADNAIKRHLKLLYKAVLYRFNLLK